MKSNICEQHNLGYVKICCGEACRKQLCETCCADHKGPEHQILTKEEYQSKAQANVTFFQNALNDWKKLEEKLREKEMLQRESVQKVKDAISKDFKTFLDNEQIILDNIDKDMRDLNSGNKEAHLKIQEAQAHFEQKRHENEEIIKKVGDNEWVKICEEKRDDEERMKDVIKAIELPLSSNLQSYIQESDKDVGYVFRTFLKEKAEAKEKELALQAKLSKFYLNYV